ncbi:MAG: extracellular solute-binding protein [Chloroflexi bacterium]|nr:extracellular solute-binding protein [Chloroflexota bacterium]
MRSRPLVINWKMWTTFIPTCARLSPWTGTFYCPPKDFSTLALEYNKDMFDAAGLDYPTADWTWDDLQSAAEALTDSDSGVYGMTLSADMARWIAFLYQAGGTVATDDFSAMTLINCAAKEAIDFYVGLVQDGYAAQPGRSGQWLAWRSVWSAKAALCIGRH